MNAAWVAFKAVKNAVSMEMVLANYGVMIRRIDRCYLRGRCPLPMHRSKSSRQSFIVHTDKDAWACHSQSCVAARGGHVGGNVIDFAAMENCTIREAALRLQDWFMVANSSPRPGMTAQQIIAEPAGPDLVQNQPLPFTLRGLDCFHPYLAERGIAPEIARYFGIGYFRGGGSMAGRVVIPIHDENGTLVAYAGRAVNQAEPRYRFPARFRKSLVMCNLHRAVDHGKKVVVSIRMELVRVASVQGAGEDYCPAGTGRDCTQSRPLSRVSF